MEVFTILYTPILRITIICATVFLTEHGNVIIIIIIIHALIYGLDFVWDVMVTRLLRTANRNKQDTQDTQT